MRSAISDSAVRPVVIVLLDPTSDRCACFFQAPILRRPDFLFLQAAMEPFDVAVALRVMIRRPPMGDAEPVERLDEPRRSELCPIVGGQRQAPRGCPRAAVRAPPAPPLPARLRSDNDARDSSPRSPACSSRSRPPGRPSPRWPGPDLGHVRLPDLIRFGCFHAAPLFLPSCAQTTRAHQQPTFSHHP